LVVVMVMVMVTVVVVVVVVVKLSVLQLVLHITANGKQPFLTHLHQQSHWCVN
jgi:hypothetical protein